MIFLSESLRHWPQCPPGLQPRQGQGYWLRGRPAEDLGSCHPFLKLPGSNKLRTLPDGLWLNFGGTAEDPFVLEASVTDHVLAALIQRRATHGR